MALCAIWYHSYSLKNVKNTYGGVLVLVKLQTHASACNKSNTLPWVFFTFFKLYKWYQIPQNITYKQTWKQDSASRQNLSGNTISRKVQRGWARMEIDMSIKIPIKWELWKPLKYHYWILKDIWLAFSFNHLLLVTLLSLLLQFS